MLSRPIIRKYKFLFQARYFDWALGVLAENFLPGIWRRDPSKQVNCTCVVTASRNLVRNVFYLIFFSFFFTKLGTRGCTNVCNYTKFNKFYRFYWIINTIESCTRRERENLKGRCLICGSFLLKFSNKRIYRKIWCCRDSDTKIDIYYLIMRVEIEKGKNLFSFE